MQQNDRTLANGAGSNGAIAPGMAGSQIQNWGKSGAYSKREIPMLQRAVRAGVLFEAH